MAHHVFLPCQLTRKCWLAGALAGLPRELCHAIAHTLAALYPVRVALSLKHAAFVAHGVLWVAEREACLFRPVRLAREAVDVGYCRGRVFVLTAAGALWSTPAAIGPTWRMHALGVARLACCWQRVATATTDGALWLSRRDDSGDFECVCRVAGTVAALAVSDEHVLALTHSGEVWRATGGCAAAPINLSVAVRGGYRVVGVCCSDFLDAVLLDNGRAHILTTLAESAHVRTLCAYGEAILVVPERGPMYYYGDGGVAHMIRTRTSALPPEAVTLAALLGELAIASDGRVWVNRPRRGDAFVPVAFGAWRTHDWVV